MDFKYHESGSRYLRGNKKDPSDKEDTLVKFSDSLYALSSDRSPTVIPSFNKKVLDTV